MKMKKKYLINGKKYWQSLDQLANTPEYRKFLKEQYQEITEESLSGISRRKFLGLMAASLAMASLAGCRKPIEKIVPYVIQPEEIIPGVADFYATTMPFGNSAFGLVVECHEGRPTKIEGNKDHPSTMGASNTLIQAQMLSLYDPDRSQKVQHNSAEDDYANFISFWRDRLEHFKSTKGRGLAILAEPFSSPTLARHRKDLLKMLPEANWITYEPISDENIYAAAENVTGENVRPVYDFAKAKIILALDSDFMYSESENIASARGFADGRRLENEHDGMNRLYVVEDAYSITGGMADHRLRVRSSEIGDFLIALASELKANGIYLEGFQFDSQNKFDSKWINAVAKDLINSRGKSIIVAGRRQPVWVHELVFSINDTLGNSGNTLEFQEFKDATLSSAKDLKLLASQMADGSIDTLVILGGNPVYDSPVDLNFIEAIHKVQHAVHLSSYVDETSRLAEWHIPRAHFLESWGDARAIDGTISVVQPMIEPLYGGHPDTELYALLATGRDIRGYDTVRETWKGFLDRGDFEKEWRRVLHDGLLKNSSTGNKNIRIRKSINDIVSSGNLRTNEVSADNLDINFYPSQLHDGRFANNGWLQELPDPVTKLAWDNAAVVSPKTAEMLKVKNFELAELQYNGRKLTLPVWIVPGQADYSVGLALGYGRAKVGRVAEGVGFNTYKLRTSQTPYAAAGAKLIPTGEIYELANTQDHFSMENRPIIREASLDEFQYDPEFAREMVEHPPLESIYPDYDYSKGYQWGMVIDLNTCIGCNACVIACQSENNIPLVGKEQVGKGREMHWIRNDRYFSGDLDAPEMMHMPVACQHCENAPCESVCPVGATMHDKEGLNVMTYNRCIGTRYCSNNCPFKVRRFNFFNYVKDMPEVVKMAQNPDVTVRSRGVMEKCTFCIQRINRAKQNARKAGRPVHDGEFQTACQQACPTNAIHFGNINDLKSRVANLKRDPRNYDLLGELNIRPRNSYLAKIRNQNPALKDYKPKVV